MPVDAFGLGRVLEPLTTGTVAARITNSGGGGIVAYATSKDEASADRWALADWSRLLDYDAGEPVVIPIAVATKRADSTDLFTSAVGGRRRAVQRPKKPPAEGEIVQGTDIAITNRCEVVVKLTVDPTSRCPSETASGTLRFYASDGQTYEKEIELGLLETVTIPDVIRSAFEITTDAIGFLEFEPTSGLFAVTSRMFTRVGGSPATFGTTVPVVGRSLALRQGQTRRIGGLPDSTTSTIENKTPGTSRTNFGLLEVLGEPASIVVSIFFDDPRALAAGAPIGTKQFDLSPREFLGVDNMVLSLIGEQRNTLYGDLENVQIRFDVVGETGAVMVYTSSIDNGSADTILRSE